MDAPSPETVIIMIQGSRLHSPAETRPPSAQPQVWAPRGTRRACRAQSGPAGPAGGDACVRSVLPAPPDPRRPRATPGLLPPLSSELAFLCVSFRKGVRGRGPEAQGPRPGGRGHTRAWACSPAAPPPARLRALLSPHRTSHLTPQNPPSSPPQHTTHRAARRSATEPHTPAVWNPELD